VFDMASVRLALFSCLFVTLSLVWGPPLLVAGAIADAPPRGDGPSQVVVPDYGTNEVELTLEVADASGRLIPARAQVIGADGHARPQGPDSDLMSHSSLGGYFYVAGRATLKVPAGLTRVTLSRGFEYSPVSLYVTLQGDSTVQVTLERFAALPARGWFGGDLHSHARHLPLDYELTPEQVKVVAEAEGISVLHLLDNDWQFTGTPHALSDSTTLLYCTYEHRNQTCGHVSLPGLRMPVSTGCCLNPASPYPMILDLNAQVHAQGGGLTVLAHPHTTDYYDLLGGWPGAGLGRELPVLAALGGLDALDVASFSNNPNLDTAEWFDLLSAGLAVPPSAGTDAVLNWYAHPPPGGWRVYTRQAGSGTLDYDSWLAALAAGHSFITSFPLVPEFTVGDSGMGDSLEVAGDSLIAPVHIETSCAIGLRSVALVADGQEIWSRSFATLPVTFGFDTTFQLRVRRPGWVLLRVDGPSSHPTLAAPQAVAYTNAVRILRDGAPAQLPAAMERLLAEVDRFEGLVTARCDWPVSWQRDTVLARSQRARRFYAQPFQNPPADFALLSRLAGPEGMSELVWQTAVDPDAGDRVRYTVRIAEDSTLSDSWSLQTADTTATEISLESGRWYWWSVEAADLAGNVVHATPPGARFFLPSTADVPVAHLDAPPQALPNPSRGAVALRGMGPDVAIYDMAGRRVAESGHGIVSAAGTLVWDGNVGGRSAPAGIYLARSGHSQRLVRIVRLR
jgi:hypothetical protein